MPIRAPSSGGSVRPCVGARPIGLRDEMPDAVLCEQPSQLTAFDVGPAVVGHQPGRGDAVARVEGERALEEADDGGGFLVVVDLGVGEA